MLKNKSLLLFVAYIVFLFLIYSVHGRGQYSVSSWLNWKFWIPAVVFFVGGLGGFRKGKTITGTTWRGTRFSGFLDEGAVQGTDGLAGAVALSLAFISVYIVLALISETAGKNLFGSVPGITTLIVGAILFALMIPLYFLFLRLFRSQKMASWMICGGWAVFLIIASRM